MEVYTGVSGWTARGKWGVQLCGAGTPGMCEALARLTPGANFYSVSHSTTCNGCLISKACSSITTSEDYANHTYYQMVNPVFRNESSNSAVDLESSCRRVVTATVVEGTGGGETPGTSTGWIFNLTGTCKLDSGGVQGDVTAQFGSLASGSTKSVFVPGISAFSCDNTISLGQGTNRTVWAIEVSTKCY